MTKINIISAIIVNIFLTGILFAKDAPDFTLTSLDNKEVSLSDFKGKVVIVNFWATWCSPCIHEMPDLEKLNQQFKKDGLQILGLTVSSPQKQIPEKVKKTGVTYPVLLDAEIVVEKFGGFSSIPQTFIIDRKGKIVKQITGIRSFKEFSAEIKKLL